MVLAVGPGTMKRTLSSCHKWAMADAARIDM